MYNEYFGFRIAPFNITPDPDLYCTNAVYQEAFASLQYGITAKRGFMLLTGEAGTGKTTLLHKLLRSLGPDTHSVFIFNTQIKFDDLLRLTLEDLGLPRHSPDRVTLIESLNAYLIERLAEGHITCLLIDEAQNLSSETLEGLRLLSNLETDKEKLLQIVLVGHPELETNLDQPEVRQLKQRVTVRCRLSALKRTEVGSYINFRLKAAGYEGHNLFSDGAVERIVAYSDGVPRVINIICDNALLTAYALCQKEVSGEVINEIASDLRLTESKQFPAPQSEPRIFQSPNQSPTYPEPKVKPEEPWRSRGSGNLVPIAVATRSAEIPKISQTAFIVGAFVILFGGTGAFMYSQEGRKYLAGLGADLQEFVERSPLTRPPVSQEQKTPEPVKESQGQLLSRQPIQSEDTLAARSSGGPSTPPISDDSSQKDTPDLTAEKSVVDKQSPEIRPEKDTAPQRKKVEAAIQKAIQNRAIPGVSVHFTDGVAYLDGEVATETQKTMAERAARSVSDVRQVRNRVSIKRFQSGTP